MAIRRPFIRRRVSRPANGHFIGRRRKPYRKAGTAKTRGHTAVIEHPRVGTIESRARKLKRFAAANAHKVGGLVGNLANLSTTVYSAFKTIDADSKKEAQVVNKLTEEVGSEIAADNQNSHTTAELAKVMEDEISKEGKGMESWEKMQEAAAERHKAWLLAQTGIDAGSGILNIVKAIPVLGELVGDGVDEARTVEQMASRAVQVGQTVDDIVSSIKESSFKAITNDEAKADHIIHAMNHGKKIATDTPKDVAINIGGLNNIKKLAASTNAIMAAKNRAYIPHKNIEIFLPGKSYRMGEAREDNALMRSAVIRVTCVTTQLQWQLSLNDEYASPGSIKLNYQIGILEPDKTVVNATRIKYHLIYGKVLPIPVGMTRLVYDLRVSGISLLKCAEYCLELADKTTSSMISTICSYGDGGALPEALALHILDIQHPSKLFNFDVSKKNINDYTKNFKNLASSAFVTNTGTARSRNLATDSNPALPRGQFKIKFPYHITTGNRFGGYIDKIVGLESFEFKYVFTASKKKNNTSAWTTIALALYRIPRSTLGTLATYSSTIAGRTATSISFTAYGDVGYCSYTLPATTTDRVFVTYPGDIITEISIGYQAESDSSTIDLSGVRDVQVPSKGFVNDATVNEADFVNSNSSISYARGATFI